MAANPPVQDLVDLNKLEWLDLSDLVRMDAEWRHTLVLVTRLHFGISVVLAAGTLIVGVVLRPESDAMTFLLCGGIVAAIAAMGYLLWWARNDEERLVKSLWPLVTLSILAVTFTVFFLRGLQGDFFLLYLLPLISAAGYLGFTGGLGAGLASALAYSTIVALSVEFTGPVVSALLLRDVIFILVPGLFGLITERHLSLLDALRASHTQAIYLAVTDTKTGLFNQRYLATRLRSEIARAERAKLPLSFLVIDVNNLSAINHEQGFSAGDAVLDALGKIVQKQLRATDVPSRWGADEFGILLYNSDAAGAEIVAKRVAADISAEPIKNPETGQPIPVSIAQGIATFPAHTKDRSGSELTERAETALRQAKARDGKSNSIAIYSNGHSG